MSKEFAGGIPPQEKNIESLMGSTPSPEHIVKVGDKLSHLETYLKDKPPYVYEFAKYLAKRANEEINPDGFDNLVAAALDDLETGKDGISGKPISGELLEKMKVLVGPNNPNIGVFKKRHIPDIKKVIFEIK